MKGLSAKFAVAATVALSSVGSATFSQTLSFSVDQLASSGAPGSTLDFTGVVTNQTGFSLASTDFFLNFYNYDPNSLNPNQILGSSEFTLPNNTYSADVDLFSVAISSGIPSGIQSLAVALEDVNGDVSNEVDLSISVTGTVSQAPEIDLSGTSSALILLFGSIACLHSPGRRRLAPEADVAGVADAKES